VQGAGRLILGLLSVSVISGRDDAAIVAGQAVFGVEGLGDTAGDGVSLVAVAVIGKTVADVLVVGVEAVAAALVGSGVARAASLADFIAVRLSVNPYALS
jgi:hypothetical protein